MSYIGNPIVSTDFPVDYASGNGSTTAFTLSVAPASVNSIDVQISGVSQSPQTYSVSGTTLTFSAAPPTGTNNIVVRHLGIAGIPNTPSAGSVVPSSIGTGYSLWNLSGSDVNYTAGNVGIGTSSPTNFGSTFRLMEVKGTDYGVIQATSTSGSTTIEMMGASGIGYLGTRTNHPLVLRTNDTERMRIDASGNLLVNTTAQFNSGKMCMEFNGNGNLALTIRNTVSTNQAIIGFYNSSGTNIGSIQQNSFTTVAFITSSDYRLKEKITPLTGALDTVAQLKPVNYTWKDSGESDNGFIAHELQTVLPNAVTGEKDAVEEDGSIKPQGVDYSKVVATLTAAIQELNAKVEAQALEIQALKGTV